MKICLISRNINGNYRGSFEFDQARALKQSGNEVYVISLDFRSVRRKRKIGLYWDVHEGINVLRCSYPLGRINSKVFYAAGKRLFERAYNAMIQKAGAVDIIHAHFLETAYVAALVLKEKLADDTPFIVTEHSSLVNDDIENLSADIVSKARYVYPKADRVIAVSDALAEKIKANFNIDCDVVYNVMDTDIFRLTEKRETPDKNGFVFVSAGNLLPNKRMDLMIDCFYKAFQNDENVSLYVFGDGVEKQRLSALICKMNMSDRVFLMGRKSRWDIADFYKNADAFVLLSKRETFGVAYVEAMAAGLPVAACHSGGPEGFVKPEVGILADSEEDIINALRFIRDNISDYNRENISRYAAEICSPEVIAGKLNKIYKEFS